jgi:hypothetical protein
MLGAETMFDLWMIIVRWLVVLFTGKIEFARKVYSPVPVRADSGPHRGESYPASSPSIGWMTMRLDPVPRKRVSPDRALTQGVLPTRRTLMPRGGA